MRVFVRAAPYLATRSANCVSAIWQAASCARRSPCTCTGRRTFFSMNVMMVLLSLPASYSFIGAMRRPFGVDLGRVRGVRARDAAADVGVMAARAGEREPFAFVIERLEDEDVRQVHAAVERVVHDEHVALRHVVAEVAHDRGERGRHRAEMPGQCQALRDKPPLGVGEAGRIIHVVLEHARIGRAEDRQRHVVGHREQRVLEELEGDRIETVRHLSSLRHLPRLKSCAALPPSTASFSAAVRNGQCLRT